MVSYDTIQKFKDGLQELELQYLIERLRVQHGEYTFPEPVQFVYGWNDHGCALREMTGLRLSEPRVVFYVKDADGATYTFEYGSCVVPIRVGELSRLANLIPDYYLDPVVLSMGYRDFAKPRFVDTGEIVPDDQEFDRRVVVADFEHHTVTAYSRADGACPLRGRAADEAVFKARKMLDGGATLAEAARFLWDATGIDIPF